MPALEWGTIKEGTPKERREHGMSLFMTVLSGTSTFEALAKQYPQATTFRDDLAALHRIAALFMDFQNQTPQATSALRMTSEVLESLVRDRPDNADYKTRLAEALVALGKLQKRAGNPDKAIANYERAIVLREELAAAAPDDKTIEQDLKSAKRDLERLKTAPAKPAAPATAEAADSPPPAVQ